MPATRTKPTRTLGFLLSLSLLVSTAIFGLQASPLNAPKVDNPTTLPAYVLNDASAIGAKPVGPTAVEGWVVSANNAAPVVGAKVSIGKQKLGVTGDDGYFSVPVSALPLGGKPTSDGAIALSFRIDASGFAPWTISAARYYAGDVLRLYPKLQTEGRAAVEQSAAQSRQAPARSLSADSPPQSGVTSLDYKGQLGVLSTNAALAPPATIRVYRTATNQVEVVPFKDYVKHVLPNEWIPTWHPESLKAGAMAVKSYGWYWVSRGGKQAALGADVKDNIEDQVYDPNVSYASTDAAVDSTFNYAITLGGSLFQAQYCAGSYAGDPGGDCPWSGLYMTQWGSAFHADQGKTWGWILQFYYTGAVISPNPPGGGYTGTPSSRATPTAASPAPATPVPPANGTFAIGQGSDRADLFQDAYARNGGTSVLGVPVGPVRWWLTYVTEFNVHAQRFSGADGRNNVWIVYDVLKASTLGVRRAFVVAGSIGVEYASHTPPGPEWLGPPTSDPYTAGTVAGGYLSQGFVNGTLAATGAGVKYTSWPDQIHAWKAEYFAGHDAASLQNGAQYSLGGQPSLVADVAAPSFDWSSAPEMARTMGVGTRDWSVQLSRELTVQPGSYNFQLAANGGVRLWVDGVLAVNSWQDRKGIENFSYNADLGDGLHRVRVQYYSNGGGAVLGFTLAPKAAKVAPPAPVAPPLPPPAAPPPAAPPATAAVRIQVQWLGRGPAPSDRWVQPLKLQLSVPGNPATVASYNATTDRNGVAFFTGLPGGVYDLHVKGPHSLQSARASIDLKTGGSVDVDMKTQVEGDVDGDNCVTPDDLGRVQSMLGTDKGMPGFSPAADLNGDGSVTMADLSLLRSGFDRCGDISADNEFHTMSADQGPTLSAVLAPWTDPAALQHTLTLSMSASASEARAGDIIKIDVLAQTGTQAVDGAAFLLHYDPQRFAPIDANGKPAAGADPGLMLPAVMGNWIDAKGGMVGYACGMLQGDPPAGRFTLASLTFRVLPGGTGAPVPFSFEALPSHHVQLTNGGENLLAAAQGLAVTVNP